MRVQECKSAGVQVCKCLRAVAGEILDSQFLA
jgi:hypothetical protein